jgi:group I intron endonuclease
MRLSGVYSITNLQTNQIYIGRSIDLKKRISKHKRMLRHNRHTNKHLQNSWNKYGEDMFIFNTILLAEPDKLKELEQKYLDSLDYDKDFNISKDSSAPMYGRKHTKDAREKISKGNLGKKMLQSSKIAISKANTGSRRTDKQKELMSKRRSNKLSDEDVREIRKYSKNGLTSIQISAMYNVCSRYIRNIISFKRRRYVK